VHLDEISKSTQKKNYNMIQVEVFWFVMPCIVLVIY